MIPLTYIGTEPRAWPTLRLIVSPGDVIERPEAEVEGLLLTGLFEEGGEPTSSDEEPTSSDDKEPTSSTEEPTSSEEPESSTEEPESSDEPLLAEDDPDMTMGTPPERTEETS